MNLPLAWMPGPIEWTVILVIALLLFGRRLPEVMRSMGRGVVEFKKGLQGVTDEIDEVKGEVRRVPDDKKADEIT